MNRKNCENKNVYLLFRFIIDQNANVSTSTAFRRKRKREQQVFNNLIVTNNNNV